MTKSELEMRWILNPECEEGEISQVASRQQQTSGDTIRLLPPRFFVRIMLENRFQCGSTSVVVDFAKMRVVGSAANAVNVKKSDESAPQEPKPGA
jgi:hypothetical protein